MLTITKSPHSNTPYVNNFFTNFVACEYSCLSSLLSDLQSRAKPTVYLKIVNMRNHKLVIQLTFYLTFAYETLKLFIQTWERAKPRLVISRITLYLDL